MAEARLREGKALLNKRYYDGAYYLTGYAVECALKACIAKRTKKHDFPDKDLALKSYTHNLKNLVGVSELEQELNIETQRDRAFEVNWAVVKDWNEGSRYERHGPEAAKSLYVAVADTKHGVLRWLKRHW